MKNIWFILCVLIGVWVSIAFPSLFTHIGNFKLTGLIIPILQIIMFGMGSQMSFHDFAGVVKMPKPVLIGVLCQYSIMPLVGYTLTKMYGFHPEIAAGIILVGASPGGLASNVVTFLAKGNLALSLTLTAISTMLSPLFTPFIMKLLAGKFIYVDVVKMMVDILKMIILPIIIGLIFHHLFKNSVKKLSKVLTVISQVGIIAIIIIITASGSDSLRTIGWLLVSACIIHNLFGYGLGYGLARLLKLSEKDARTIAIEVGMQNSGMASGLAVLMGKVSSVGLAPAVFGPLQNISGAILAAFWGKEKKCQQALKIAPFPALKKDPPV